MRQISKEQSWPVVSDVLTEALGETGDAILFCGQEEIDSLIASAQSVISSLEFVCNECFVDSDFDPEYTEYKRLKSKFGGDE